MNRFTPGTLCLLLLMVPYLAAQDDVQPRPAEVMPLAEKSLLLDVIAADDLLVAAGARGHVLTSVDGGESWEQSSGVPVRATLTRIDAAGGELWAVGHDSVILHSADRGRSWTLQHFEPEWEQPLLDVLFLDSRRGFAVGAYSLFMTTTDGGETWEALEMADLITSEAIDWPEQSGAELMADDPDAYYDASTDFDKGCYEYMECHLNDIVLMDDGRMVIVAERGYGFRSVDDGESWESFRFPYSGSMFGIIQQKDCLVAFGLRGHIQKSCDFGDTWEPIDAGTESSLMGGIVTDDDTTIMVGASSTVVRLPLEGAPVVSSERLGSDLAAVALRPGSDGLVAVGEDGIRVVGGIDR